MSANYRQLSESKTFFKVNFVTWKCYKHLKFNCKHSKGLFFLGFLFLHIVKARTKCLYFFIWRNKHVNTLSTLQQVNESLFASIVADIFCAVSQTNRALTSIWNPVKFRCRHRLHHDRLSSYSQPQIWMHENKLTNVWHMKLSMSTNRTVKMVQTYRTNCINWACDATLIIKLKTRLILCWIRHLK